MTSEQEEIDLVESPEKGGRPTPGKADWHELEPRVPAARRSPRRWLALLGLVVAAAAVAAWWLSSRGHESTDDAQVEGHLDLVSARISGTVISLSPQLENNRFVKAGTLLVELDSRDYQADLEHAKANLDTRAGDVRSAQVTVPIVDASAFGLLHSAEAARAQAIAAVDSLEADLAGAQHNLERDQAIYARAERDRARYQALVEKHEISRSEYDARQTDAVAAAQAVESNRATLVSAQHKIIAARSLVAQREAQMDAARTAPEQGSDARAKVQSAGGRLEQARADLHTAQLNLSYTKIYAPVSGIIGRKTVELGHRVQPGQSLLVIVPLDDLWITANFKETQLKRMRPGQPVRIHVDTFDRDYSGKVESMPGGAGPLFSLFPPENSSGNYVKVVQRFPVRLRLNPGQDPQQLLRPGMSVEANADVR